MNTNIFPIRLSAILLLSLSLCACESPESDSEAAGSDCRDQVLAKDKEIDTLRVENYSLQKKIDALNEKLQQENKNCDIAQSIEKNAAERRESAEREKEKLQQKAEIILGAKKTLIARAEKGLITIAEWQEILFGKSKTEVLEILGKPTSVKRPGLSNELVNEIWSYPGKALIEGSTTQHTALIVQLSDDKVQRVTAGR